MARRLALLDSEHAVGELERDVRRHALRFCPHFHLPSMSLAFRFGLKEIIDGTLHTRKERRQVVVDDDDAAGMHLVIGLVETLIDRRVQVTIVKSKGDPLRILLSMDVAKRALVNIWWRQPGKVEARKEVVDPRSQPPATEGFSAPLSPPPWSGSPCQLSYT